MDANNPLEDCRSVQKVWNKPIIDACFMQLKRDLITAVLPKAQLLACSTSEAGFWLNALSVR